ncbi:MAG: preprotein translocase subunit SecG [Succinivibrionaceae bacterium]
MSLAYSILLVIFLIVAIFLIVFILVQQGKGASMGASFGAGASNTLFGSAGSANFFTKSTWLLTALFFIICIVLGYLNSHRDRSNVDDFSNISTSEQVVNNNEPKIVKELPATETKEVVAPVVEEKKAEESTTPVVEEQKTEVKAEEAVVQAPVVEEQKTEEANTVSTEQQ